VFHVRGASTADIPALATFTVAGVDGLTYIQGERILLKDQTNTEECGIFEVGTVAGGLAALTRALDADGADEFVAGMIVVVAEGTLGADTAWHLDTNDPLVLDTTPLVFTERMFGFGLAAALENVDGAAENAGVATTAARIDHKHSLPAAVAPEDVTKAAAVAGVSINVARADHKHNITTAAPTAAVIPGAAFVEGVATTMSPSDHSHQVDCAAAVAAGIGDAGTEGAAVTFARSDHTHIIAAPAAPADVDAAAAAAGVATTFARSDHKHDISATSDLVVQMRQYQFTAADLTAAGTTQTINLGAALPANTYIYGWSYDLQDAFDNGGMASIDVTLGFAANDDCLCGAFDAFTGSANEAVPGGGTAGVGSNGYPLVAGGQLITVWTANADQLLNVTNGDLTITVLFTTIA